jgi:hypothetical protein
MHRLGINKGCCVHLAVALCACCFALLLLNLTPIGAHGGFAPPRTTGWALPNGVLTNPAIPYNIPILPNGRMPALILPNRRALIPPVHLNPPPLGNVVGASSWNSRQTRPRYVRQDPEPRPVSIGAIGKQYVPVGGKLHLQLLFEGQPFTDVTYAINPHPAASFFDPNTGIFFWRPERSQAGVYYITFSARRRNAIACETGFVHVAHPNSSIVVDEYPCFPPDNQSDETTYDNTEEDTNLELVMEPIGDQEITEGEELEFRVRLAEGSAGDNYFDVADIPSDASFSSGFGSGWGVGKFSWKPDFGQAGDYYPIFRVSNGQLSQKVRIHVRESDAKPEFDYFPITKSVKVGEAINIAINATHKLNAKLAYSADSLPEGAAFNADTHILSWTPKESQTGHYAVRIKASDGRHEALKDVTINVRK